MDNFISRPSASIPHAINEPREQPNTTVIAARGVFLDLQPANYYEPGPRPKSDQKKYSYLQSMTRDEQVEAAHLKQKNNWLDVPNFRNAILDYSNKKPDASGKELDEYIAAMHTDNVIKVVQKKIDPVELAVSINSLNTYDAIHSDNIPMIKWWVEQHSNLIQSLIDEQDPVKFSSLLSDFNKMSRQSEYPLSFAASGNHWPLENDVLTNPNLSASQQEILYHLYKDGISETILSMTLHPMFENKTDGEFLNALLKLSNGLIPSHSGKYCVSTFVWAGEARNAELVKILCDNVNSEYLMGIHRRAPNLSRHYDDASDEALAFIGDIVFREGFSRFHDLITTNQPPKTLKILLQKHDSGELQLRNVDFLNPYVYNEAGLENFNILISRPEVPTMHILDAREICSNIQERNPYDRHNSKLIDIIDAELARRAEQ